MWGWVSSSCSTARRARGSSVVGARRLRCRFGCAPARNRRAGVPQRSVASYVSREFSPLRRGNSMGTFWLMVTLSNGKSALGGRMGAGSGERFQCLRSAIRVDSAHWPPLGRSRRRPRTQKPLVQAVFRGRSAALRRAGARISEDGISGPRGLTVQLECLIFLHANKLWLDVNVQSDHLHDLGFRTGVSRRPPKPLRSNGRSSRAR